jgi:hypothetical protein
MRFNPEEYALSLEDGGLDMFPSVYSMPTMAAPMSEPVFLAPTFPQIAQQSFPQVAQSAPQAAPQAPPQVVPQATPQVPAQSAQDRLVQQILAGGTTGWSGQGYGSAQANAADMAKILAGIGITDINQFGKIPQYETQAQYKGQPVNVDEDGNTYIMAQGAGGVDDYGNPMPGKQVVDPKQVEQVQVKTGEQFGNKLTGQVVPNTYSERQTGDFFGGTFAGAGNTGYGVKFDAQGNPQFYTKGASSSDIGNLGQLATVALSVAFPEFAPLISGASTALQGGTLKDVIKSAALGYAGQQVMGALNAPEVGPAPTAPELPSSFDQYLAKTPSPILSSVAATTPEVAPQIAQAVAQPTVGPPPTPEALSESLQQYITPEQTKQAIAQIQPTEPIVPPVEPPVTPQPVAPEVAPQAPQQVIPEQVAPQPEVAPQPQVAPEPVKPTTLADVANIAPPVQPQTTLADVAATAPPPPAPLADQTSLANIATVPTETAAQTAAQQLQDELAKYKLPPQTLAEIANVGPSPIAPENIPELNPYLQQNPPTEVGSQEAIKRLQDNLEQYKATTAPVVPTDVAAAPAATTQTPLADIANIGPSTTQEPLPPSFDQYKVSPYSLAPTNPNLTEMGGAQGITPPTAGNLPDMGGAQGFIPTANNSLPPLGIAQPETVAGNLGQNLAALNTNVPQATNYQIPSPMGGAQGIQPSTNPNVDAMGGGQGIIAPTSANLADMGGGQGLTALAAGGGVLGATGVNTGASLAGSLGSGLNAINTGVTAPASTGGSKMSDLLSGLSPSQIASLGSGLLGAIGGINANSAINSAQGIQSAAAQKSLGTLGDIYGKNMESIAPYQQAGQAGLSQINQQLPYFTHQFDANDLNAQLAPNYQFMLGQGQMANQRAANVGGGALSGNTLQGLNQYTQNYAGNAYQNAFQNYNSQRNNIANTLSGIAGLGSTANQQGIGAGTSYGQNVTNLNTGLAAAQAAATIGKAQNTSNTISNLGNAGFLASLLGQSSGVSNADTAINPYFSIFGGP